jgi:hypothetical protein
MRDKQFGFVLSAEERRLLAELARKQRRTQGDLLRVLIRRAADEEPASPARELEAAHADR